MMRKALVVGIDCYQHFSSLNGCVNDANSIKAVLDRNSDGTINFDVKLLTATSSSTVTKKILKESVMELFKDNNDDIALFYFAGHGHVESTGGYLITSENTDADAGFPMSELIKIANDSSAKNKIIVLDCCHSGECGNSSYDDAAILKEGTTILTASSLVQYASEENGSGVFTKLFVDAMNGSASNLVGDITPGSIYAHIDQSLGPWEQRPIFKTNVKEFVKLRKVQPPISLSELQMITTLFPTSGYEYPLDPEYEPAEKHGDLEKEQIFRVLQNYNRVNLVVPVGEDHMYYAAINSKSCKLTILGEHYWKLVEKNRI